MCCIQTFGMLCPVKVVLKVDQRLQVAELCTTTKLEQDP